MNTSTATHEKSHVFKRASWFEHIELIMALFSGVLIVLAYLAEKQVGTPWIYVTLYLSAFLIGGYAKAKEGLTDTWETRSLNVELLMISVPPRSGTGWKVPSSFSFSPYPVRSRRIR